MTSYSAEINLSPAAHNNIMYGVSWAAPIAHNDDAIINNCARSDSGDFSQCYIALSADLHFPSGATHLNVRVKSKIWSRDWESGYCLSYLYVLDNNLLNPSNHFEHTELWFDYAERRVIDYATIKVPVVDDKVVFGIGKQITGGCLIEMAFYLEGYDI